MTRELTDRTLDSRAHFCALHPFYMRAAALVAMNPAATADIAHGVAEAPDDGAGMADAYFEDLPEAERAQIAVRAERVARQRVEMVTARCVEAAERVRFDIADLDPDTLAVVAVAWPQPATRED